MSEDNEPDDFGSDDPANLFGETSIFQDARDLCFYDRKPRTVFLKRLAGIGKIDTVTGEVSEVPVKEADNDLLDSLCQMLAGKRTVQFAYTIASVLDTAPLTVAVLDDNCEVKYGEPAWIKTIDCAQDTVYLFDDQSHEKPLLKAGVIDKGKDTERVVVRIRNDNTGEYSVLPESVCGTAGQLNYICLWHCKGGIAGK